ncbi:MAG: pyridoxal phosphate-dependent aminotransferase [bacterium]
MTLSVLEKAGKKFRSEGMSDRVKNIIMSPIKEMMVLAAEKENTVSLAQGIPSMDTPQHIKDAACAAIQGSVAGKYCLLYGIKELREELAKRLREQRNADIEPLKEICITAGAMESLAAIALTIINSNDEVILLSPVYSPMIEHVRLCGGKPVFIDLKEEEGWGIDLEKLEKAITEKTKAIIFSNPMNPTGAVLSEEELKQIAELVIKNNIFIISDETYNFLVYDGLPYFSLLSMPELKNNLISIGSFSKNYAMTGYRCGYVVAEEGIINQMAKIHDALVVCGPVVSQFAALAALKGPQDCAREMKEDMQAKRDLMCARLDKLSSVFSYAKPKGAYYIMAKILKPNVGNSFDFAIDLLNNTGVVTVPGGAFGPLGEKYLRFSFGGSREVINEAFDRMEKYFGV